MDPVSEFDLLAFLYLKSQDLTGKTPDEIADAYYSARYEFKRCRRQMRNAGYFSEKESELMKF